MRTASSARWVASGREVPCPVCGRSTDSKCRWAPDLILCYPGSRFAPPDVPPGGVITLADGSQWFRCRADGGFSGGHAVFRPHRPDFRSKGMAKGLPPQRGVDVAGVVGQAKRLRKSVQIALQMRPFELCSITELKEYYRILKALEGRLEALADDLAKVRNPSSEVQRHRLAQREWQQQIRYQREDLERFRRTALGEPVVAS